MAVTLNLGGGKLRFESGYIYVTDSSHQESRVAVSSILRALDIPIGLDYNQVQGLSALASLMSTLIRTLIDRQILDESFLEKGEYNLNDIIETIENLGGSFGDPDLTVDTQPTS